MGPARSPARTSSQASRQLLDRDDRRRDADLRSGRHRGLPRRRIPCRPRRQVRREGCRVSAERSGFRSRVAGARPPRRRGRPPQHRPDRQLPAPPAGKLRRSPRCRRPRPARCLEKHRRRLDAPGTHHRCRCGEISRCSTIRSHRLVCLEIGRPLRRCLVAPAGRRLHHVHIGHQRALQGRADAACPLLLVRPRCDRRTATDMRGPLLHCAPIVPCQRPADAAGRSPDCGHPRSGPPTLQRECLAR